MPPSRQAQPAAAVAPEATIRLNAEPYALGLAVVMLVTGMPVPFPMSCPASVSVAEGVVRIGTGNTVDPSAIVVLKPPAAMAVIGWQ